MLNNEERRLHTLHALELLDTLPEEEFDQLVELASEICDTPISLFSLVDEQRQWFKAAKGLTATETHRNVSFCAHAIRQPDSIFVVEDATRDPRFTSNELVTGPLGIRFYAGTPLQAPDGHSIGTLCVIDTVPRRLSPSQYRALNILGRQVEARVSLRAKQQALEATLAANECLSASLQKSNDLFRAFMDHSPFMGYIKSCAGRYIFYNRKLSNQFNITADAWVGKSDADLFPPDLAETYREHDLQVLAGNTAIEFDEVSPGPEGALIHWRSYKFPFRQPDGELMLAGISMDISESLLREQQLQRSLLEQNALATHLESSRALFHAFADLSPHLTYLKSEDGRYIFYNRLYAEHFGVTQTEWIGKCSYEMLPPELAERSRCGDQAVLASGERGETQNTVTTSSGETLTYRSLKFTYRDAEGHRMLAGIAIDITEQIGREQALTAANRRLDQLATTDALTGIANRRAFEAQIPIDFANSVRRRRSLSVLLMDIDNFKQRNDRLGHAKGDEALQILARVLTRAARISDLPARVGGEEFAVLLPETGTTGALAAARRIQTFLAQEDLGDMPLTVSIGVACLDETTQSWAGLVASADNAMYEAKRSGKNCIVAHHDHVARLMNGLVKPLEPVLLSKPDLPARSPGARPATASHSFKGRRKRSRARL